MSDQPTTDSTGDRRPGDGSETPTDPTAPVVGQQHTSPSPTQSFSSSTSNEDTSTTTGAWRPNTELLNSIVDLGFDKLLAEKALFYGSNDSLERAVNWIIDYGEKFDDGKPLNLALASSGSSLSAAATSDAQMVPFKMVFVVNNALKMGVGKVAAQVGHATLGLYRQMLGRAEQEMALMQWNEEGETKVVLRADGGEEELTQLQAQAKRSLLQTYLVADAGRTQIASGSITVLSLFGPSDRVDEITGKLKLLQ